MYGSIALVCVVMVISLTQYYGEEEVSYEKVLEESLIMAEEIKIFCYGISANCPRDLMESKFGKFGRVSDVYNTGKG